MDRLKTSNFLEALTGRVHASHYDAILSIRPELAQRTLKETSRRDSPIAATLSGGPQPRIAWCGSGCS